MTEESLFHAALAKPPTDYAIAFLDAACVGQPELRAAVDALLQAHEASGDFLNGPVVPVLAATGEYTANPAGAARGQTSDYQVTGVAGAIIAGKYKLLEAIGEGGMGTVWMAEQTRAGASGASRSSSSSRAWIRRQVLARFEAERQALAMMDHPNIAKVLDAGATR